MPVRRIQHKDNGSQICAYDIDNGVETLVGCASRGTLRELKLKSTASGHIMPSEESPRPLGLRVVRTAAGRLDSLGRAPLELALFCTTEAHPRLCLKPARIHQAGEMQQTSRSN